MPCLSHRFGDHTPTVNQFTDSVESLSTDRTENYLIIFKQEGKGEEKKQLKARNPNSGPAGGLSLTLALEDVS